MNKNAIAGIMIAGIGVAGAIISIDQYKKRRAVRTAWEQEVKKYEDYNEELEKIKSTIEAQKGTEDDFIETTRREVNRINRSFLRLVEND